MKHLLRKALKMGASDIHLTNGAPPFARVHGEIIIMGEDSLTPEINQRLINGLLNENQKAKLAQEMELCFSLTIPEMGYFRINVYYQKGHIEAAIRIGSGAVKSFQELGLPLYLKEIIRRPNGLFLITGPTGQGKTTTFNVLIDFFNREKRFKIITVEDPVEFLHTNVKSIVVQQEVYTDTKSFHRALVHILRQDPDIIGVGEMRDLETISATITAAETGHLVIATLHTSDCSQTIHRIIDVFPPHQQTQIRFQLASCLVGVINQRLLPRLDKQGRVLAYELLIANEAVRNQIRENKLQQLPNTIQIGRKEGMVFMDESIKNYYDKGIISYDTALSNMKHPNTLEKRKS